MVLKILKIVLIFVVALWAANAVFSPNIKTPQTSKQAQVLFAKDLQTKLAGGKLVIVDKDESDKYIQEDLSTHDLTKALTFARYKSEVLERPLYIESKKTYGKADSVAKVNPTDRRAWQELIVDEIALKDAYSKAHPGDIAGYQDEKALDAKKTPAVMVEFINSYPDSYVVSTALAHIEYCLCVAQEKPDQAMAIYKKLQEKHKDQPYLCSLMPEYIKRANDYKQHLAENKRLEKELAQ